MVYKKKGVLGLGMRNLKGIIKWIQGGPSTCVRSLFLKKNAEIFKMKFYFIVILQFFLGFFILSLTLLILYIQCNQSLKRTLHKAFTFWCPK